jgi:hypothetical protein
MRSLRQRDESETPATYARRAEQQPAREATSRHRKRWRAREAGAATLDAFGSAVVAIARVIIMAASLIAVLIGLAIVLRDVGANQGNTIVKGIHEGANFFAGAFTGLITFHGHPKRAITVDWGIALVVYLVVGAVISSYVRGIGTGGLRLRDHRAPIR